jgi:hypothetical protein
MSEDLRNSIYMWVAMIFFAAVFWAGMRFDIFHGLSSGWLGAIVFALGMLNLARFLWGLWQRRAANPNNPNR